MLGKLIRHEFKATWKPIVLINAFLLFFTLIGMVSFALKIWQVDSPFVIMLGSTYLILYYISIIGVVLAVSIYLMVRFYKNLYTDEGYLMHTLPVTPAQLICSKLITGSTFVFLSGLHVAICVISLFISFGVNFSDFSFSSGWYEFTTMVIPEMPQVLGMHFSTFVIIILLCILIGSANGLLMGYAAASFGQLFNKHKVLASFVSYFVIYMVFQVISSLVTLPMMTYNMVRMADVAEEEFVRSFFPSMMYTTLGLSVVMTVLLYLATYLIMKKKLNLD